MKKEFSNILNNFIFKYITDQIIKDLYYSIDLFFKKYDLTDLQYFIDTRKKDEGLIFIVGKREIDKLALEALMQ